MAEPELGTFQQAVERLLPIMGDQVWVSVDVEDSATIQPVVVLTGVLERARDPNDVPGLPLTGELTLMVGAAEITLHAEECHGTTAVRLDGTDRVGVHFFQAGHQVTVHWLREPR